MDKAKAVALGKATDAALQAVAEEFGLNVRVKGGKYDPEIGTYTPKVEFFAADKEKNEFAVYAEMFGLQADDFGKAFSLPGKGDFVIVGIKPNAQKYPVLAKSVNDGKTYKFSEAIVKVRLNMASAVK